MALNMRYLKLAMVSFVDLLGFSSRVSEAETEAQLEAIERDVRRTQEWFEHRPKEESTREMHGILEKKVLAFSDCLVISVSSHSTFARHEGEFDVLMSEAFSLSLAQARCVTNGIFIRGGSDRGMYYKRGSTLISPAMVNAYHLERSACVPMIAISDEFHKHLSEHPQRQFYSANADPSPRYFRRYDDLPNGQSHWFLDYLPLYLEAIDSSPTGAEREEWLEASGERRLDIANTSYWRNCERMAHAHKNAIVSARESAANDHVRQKYDWLSSYHNDAITRFYGDAPTALFISG